MKDGCEVRENGGRTVGVLAGSSEGGGMLMIICGPKKIITLAGTFAEGRQKKIAGGSDPSREGAAGLNFRRAVVKPSRD
jgi:hypothetical protein